MTKKQRRSSSPLVDLSRFVSRALRHAPHEFGLTLDSEGWIATEALLDAVHRRLPAWRHATEADLEQMIAESEKKRHELREGRIRALYGHSLEQEVVRTPEPPPDELYHGTAPASVAVILRDGLKPMKRQNVHLSIDVDTARRVGSRKTRTPVILRVRAGEAHAAGTPFYRGNDQVWLADAVPATFVEVFGGVSE